MRRLILRDIDGSIITKDMLHKSIEPYYINLTSIAHANTQICIRAIVQEQCNKLYWHDVSSWDIPPWGNAEWPDK